YLTEYDYKKLEDACKKAYAKFDGDPAPMVKLDENEFVLELYHGPTHAFKDMALTVLPYLLKEGCSLNGVKENVLILTATSGDTGKSALEGFRDNQGVKIMVFYPSEGVSAMQKLQMTTQLGDNVNVCAVKGNFDDCQSAVKRIFNDSKVRADLKEKGYVFSSANSINFGRLAPQIAYYFSAYSDLAEVGEIEYGEKVNFCVPTGNFGNILACYYAMQMGLPVNKLICASNKNKVLTDFFNTGVYDIKREFYKTTSPSMDILISSNLERLIFEISNRDSVLTASRMKDLVEKGSYSVSKKELEDLNKIFYAGFATEEETVDTISDYFDELDYAVDTHTAVGLKVSGDFKEEFGEEQKVVCLSTASPYKFPTDVLSAIKGKVVSDPFKASKTLSELTAMPIPENLTNLTTATIRFKTVVEREDILQEVIKFIQK
ncbi:MAG: threonine synthase, partial [Clostridia bacterium]|nr:threonine synthase [Clostridia bacterium]